MLKNAKMPLISYNNRKVSTHCCYNQLVLFYVANFVLQLVVAPDMLAQARVIFTLEAVQHQVEEVGCEFHLHASVVRRLSVVTILSLVY